MLFYHFALSMCIPNAVCSGVSTELMHRPLLRFPPSAVWKGAARWLSAQLHQPHVSLLLEFSSRAA